MGLKNKEKWLEACEQLLAYYKGELPSKKNKICPFCPIARVGCRYCVWKYFEGITCGVWYTNEISALENMESARKKLNEELAKKRIPMLKEWIKKLKKEIKEG